MALSTELDIYKAASSLLELALDVQAVLPRTFRQTLGNRITDGCAELVVLVSRANAAFGADRPPHLCTLLERLQVVVVLLRVCHAKKFIATALWSRGVELTDSVGKQANGWLKSARARAADPLSPSPAA